MGSRKSFRFVACCSLLLWVVLSGVLYVSVPYTLKSWEADALFVDTPDYWREVERLPWYGWFVVRNFLLQFFVSKEAGAVILSFFPAVAFFLLNCLLGRRKVGLYFLTGVFVGGVLCFVLREDVRKGERWAHLEYAAEKHSWKEVLEIASPEATVQDRDMLPYAMLALAVSGVLPERMMEYPVSGMEDFDMVRGGHTPRQYKFRMILYDCMGCPDEAVHNVYQLATFSPLGMTFGTLRRLIAYNKILGNRELVEKYSVILSKSSIYHYKSRGFVLKADTLRRNESGKIPLITEDMGYNMGNVLDKGFVSKELAHYFLCVLLAERRLSSFASVLNGVLPLLDGAVPVLYQEALLICASQNPALDMSGYHISEEVRSSYDEYRKGASDGKGHYWAYYAQRQ